MALWRGFAFSALLDTCLESKMENDAQRQPPSVARPGAVLRGAEGRDQPCKEQGKGILAEWTPELTGGTSYQETKVRTSAVFNPAWF